MIHPRLTTRPGNKKNPAQGRSRGSGKNAGSKSRRLRGREAATRRYFFFFLAFLAGFFLAMTDDRKFSARLHEHIFVSRRNFARAKAEKKIQRAPISASHNSATVERAKFAQIIGRRAEKFFERIGPIAPLPVAVRF